MIYFDNSASTPLTEEVKRVLVEELDLFANPSSLHRLGFEAEQRLKKAREQVASSLRAEPEEVFFTSGGTEADNLAVFGAAEKNRRVGNRVVSTDSEHPAVEECLKALEKSGWDVVRLSTRGGKIDREEAARAITEQTALLAVMRTNNETGAIYDLPYLSALTHRKNPRALVFSDGVQAYLKGDFFPAALGLDLASVSAHKVHGPKGVGALWVKKGLSLPCRAFGGGQEKNLRSGTENLPGIIAFGRAAEDGYAALSENVARMRAVRERILETLAGEKKISFLAPENAACHILSMQADFARSEVLLHALSERGVFVSSGSACSSHKGKSPVLKNYGLDPKKADVTLRLSFSSLNTLSEADEFCRILKEIIG